MKTIIRAATIGALLAGCAHYQPLPLDGGAALAAPPVHLAVDAGALALPALVAHRYDPSDGLDALEVAMIAVVNNGDLQLARADAHVARAQAFSAGLLPDPQLALAHDLSNTSTGPGASQAYTYGLSYDIGALLVRSAARGAADADSRKADLTLLWQEWQVVAQARLLFVKQVQGRKAMLLLEQTRALYADRLARTERARAKGLIGNDIVAPNLTALQDVQRQMFDLRRLQNQNQHDLNALLGLAPDTVLDLREGADFAPLDPAAVAAALPQLARRRPDLRALQAGYDAQDQRYRGALLAQFPALNVGLTRARDTSSVYSNGVGVTLTLPFLNRNRGNIAIEQATRAKLHDEYQLRLRTTLGDIDRLQREAALDQAQLAQADADVADLAATLAHSEQSYQAANVDLLVYTAARGALLAKQLERITLEQALQEQRIALQTLLGADPGAAASPEGVR